MAETLDWVYYDTQDVSTSASTDIEFFANSEAVDGLAVTNLPDANNIPSNETFEVEEIHVLATPDIAINDVYELFEEAIIEVKIAGNRKLIFPAILAGCPAHQYLCAEDINDASTAGSATPTGGPFKLKTPLKIPGGVSFQVKFRTGATAASAGDAIVIMLRGKLMRS